MTAEFLENIESVVSYVSATLNACGLQEVEPGWLKVHIGRANSSVNQLKNLLIRAKKMMMLLSPEVIALVEKWRALHADERGAAADIIECISRPSSERIITSLDLAARLLRALEES